MTKAVVLPAGFVAKSTHLGRLISQWYHQNKRDLPWRRPPINPYHVWLSEIMCQQTVIKAVLPVYARFLAAFPTIHDVAAATEDQLKQQVAGLGYYRRFRLFHQAAQGLEAWPQSYDQWLALPGIGPYTAAAISSIVLQLPHAVVDGNVERVISRLLDMRRPPNQAGLKKVFQEASSSLLDQDDPAGFNQGLMELGQSLCRVSSPLCDRCPLADHCLARLRQSQHLAPQKKLKPPSIALEMTAVVLRRRDRFGLCQRGDQNKFLKGLTGFPLIIGEHLDGNRPLDLKASTASLGPIKHTITRHKISCLVKLIDNSPSSHFCGDRIHWYHANQVGEQLVSSLDRKVWKLLIENL